MSFKEVLLIDQQTAHPDMAAHLRVSVPVSPCHEFVVVGDLVRFVYMKQLRVNKKGRAEVTFGSEFLSSCRQMPGRCRCRWYCTPGCRCCPRRYTCSSQYRSGCNHPSSIDIAHCKYPCRCMSGCKGRAERRCNSRILEPGFPGLRMQCWREKDPSRRRLAFSKLSFETPK